MPVVNNYRGALASRDFTPAKVLKHLQPYQTPARRVMQRGGVSVYHLKERDPIVLKMLKAIKDVRTYNEHPVHHLVDTLWALHDGEPAGYLELLPCGKRGMYSAVVVKVADEHRGNGIGLMLHRAAMLGCGGVLYCDYMTSRAERATWARMSRQRDVDVRVVRLVDNRVVETSDYRPDEWVERIPKYAKGVEYTLRASIKGQQLPRGW